MSGGFHQCGACGRAPEGKLTIHVIGVCDENVTVTRDDVTLLGIAPETSGIQGVTEMSLIDESPVTVRGAQGVRLENLTISGGQSSGVAASDAWVTLENCVSEGNGYHGVALVGGGFMQVNNCVLRNNVLGGVFASNGGLITVTNTAIENNVNRGVLVKQSGTVVIGKNLIDEPGPTTVSFNAGVGVQASDSGTAVIYGSTIENNGSTGVLATASSTVRLIGSTVIAPLNAMFIGDGSSAQLEAGNLIESAAGQNFAGASVSVYRNSTLRVRGGSNVFRNTAPSGSSAACNSNLGTIALDVEMTSSLRNDGGHVSIEGDVESFNLSTVDLRDVDVDGVLYVDGLGTNIRLRDQGTVPGNVEVTGGICVNSGTLSLRPIEVNGFVNCNYNFVNKAIIGGSPTFLNCP